MGKKRARKNSEDEEKENRLYKRFKRAQKELKKQEKRHRRAQKRKREVTSSESEVESSPRDSRSIVAVQKRRSNTSFEAGLESDYASATHGRSTNPRMDEVMVTATESLTEKSLDAALLDTPPLQNLTPSGVSAVLNSGEPSTGTIGEKEVVAAKNFGEPSTSTAGQTEVVAAKDFGEPSTSTSGQTEVVAVLTSGSASAAIPVVQEKAIVEVSTGVSGVSVPEKSAGSEEILDAKILELMGKRLILDRIPAPDIHKDLVVRWQEILLKGLPAEERKRMLEKYPPPANCTAIDPPKLNAEVKASLLEAIIKKDSRVVARQERVAACLAALGKSLSFILKSNRTEDLVLFESLSDTARILADIQHDDSLIRRSLILSNLNTSLKDTLNSTVVDEWLFGKNLEEQLKSAKLLERSTKDLRPEQKPQSSSSKNFKGPPRRVPFKRQPMTQGGHHHSVTQRSTSQSNFRKPLRGQGRGYPQQGHPKKWT